MLPLTGPAGRHAGAQIPWEGTVGAWRGCGAVTCGCCTSWWQCWRLVASGLGMQALGPRLSWHSLDTLRVMKDARCGPLGTKWWHWL